MVSESTTKTVLSNLLPNTRYFVTVVPIYAEGDGPSLSDSGKTSEYWLESRAQLLEGERPLKEKKKQAQSRNADKYLLQYPVPNVAPEDARAQT